MPLLQTNAQSPNILIYSGVRHIIQFSFRHAEIENYFFVPNTIIVMCKKPFTTLPKKPVVHKFRSEFFFT